MNRKAIVFGLMLFMVSVVTAFAGVTGTVTDTANEVAAGATVKFIDTSSELLHEWIAVTDDDGNYAIDFTMTAVDESVPQAFVLQQNFPNPFNPSTTIPFFLEKSGMVDLSIYNVLGQKVRTLLDGYITAGAHQPVWDGRDQIGRGVGAGIYIYQLRSGSQVESKKMLLLDGGSRSGSGGSISTQAFSSLSTASLAKTAVTIPDTLTVQVTGPTIEPLILTGVSITDGGTLNILAVSSLQITVVARMITNDGMEDAVKDSLMAFLLQTREEPGNLCFDLLQVIETPEVMLFFENWKGDDAIDTHMESDYFQNFYSKVDEYFIADNGLEVVKYKEITPPVDVYVEDPELISVITRMVAKPGKEEDVRDLLYSLTIQTRFEPGCISYDLHRGIDDPAAFMLLENWRGQAGVDAHMASDYFLSFYAQVDELFDVLEVNISNMVSTPELGLFGLF